MAACCQQQMREPSHSNAAAAAAALEHQEFMEIKFEDSAVRWREADDEHSMLCALVPWAVLREASSDSRSCWRRNCTL